MSDADVLSQAIECLNQNDFSGAEEVCRSVLRDDPANPKAWHLCGIAQAQRNHLAEAAECFEKAIEYDDQSALYHYNLGLAYKGLGQLDRAVVSYRDAIARKDRFLEARNNLANALIDLGQNRQAIDCFRELLDLFPESTDAHFNLANLLQDIGNSAAAIVHYRRALELDPNFSAGRENLGRTLTDEGHIEEAKLVWIEWLEHDPGNAVARHMLASISGENTPQRCDDDYIRETFDATFAKNYEHQLARIQYNPQLVGEAFQAIDRQMSDLDVLDAGCGTGLCGPIFRSVARRLVGVDLSNDMLAEAATRNTYDELIASEITQYMQAHAHAYDLIVAADTLCYFGELREVLRAAWVCLKERGVLIFTVESDTSGQDREYALLPHGRYCHTEKYVTTMLGPLGFTVAAVTPAVMRKERGEEVNGLVVTASRAI